MDIAVSCGAFAKKYRSMNYLKLFQGLFIASALLLSNCNMQTKKINSPVADPKLKLHKMTNMLLSQWDTPFGIPPFDKIKSSDYLPAFYKAMRLHKLEIDAIINNPEAPTFQNTIVALEKSGALLDRVSQLFYAVKGANTDDVLQATNKEIAPKLSAHYDDIGLNSRLFDRIKSVYQQREQLALDDESAFLLEKKYKDFVANGANLNDADKAKLKKINVRLAALKQQFGEHLLAETNDFDLYVTDKSLLEGVPASLLAGAAAEARKRGHASGWSFTLQRPSINPFLASCKNRDLREKIFRGYASRGDNDNANDNKAIVSEIVSLRVDKAHLLGFDTYAGYSLQNTMAQTPEKVFELLNKIWKPAIKTAKKDRDTFAAMMKKDGIDAPFRASDWRYYVAKVRAEQYNFDEEETRPYFEFTAVRRGAFELANQLFGLRFREMTEAPKWHPDQQVFEVLEADGSHLGVMYMDFFTRESKEGGAWMNELRMQSDIDGHFVTPIVTTNFNFPPPTDQTPSLLSFTEAQTLFHEFGHALHGLFSRVHYRSLSGTNVPRDFVEFPSQVMENWMSEPAVLKLYARHYKTGEVIPADMITKMNRANAFDQGFRSVEYMAAAYLDMYWHSLKDNEKRDVRAFEQQAMADIGLIEEIIPRYRSTYYSHIFQGGYAAGYYSYLWSEVLDADAFHAFKSTGNIFDPTLARKYRQMLASGGSKSGGDLYRNFMGREPNIAPLIEKLGFGE